MNANTQLSFCLQSGLAKSVTSGLLCDQSAIPHPVTPKHETPQPGDAFDPRTKRFARIEPVILGKIHARCPRGNQLTSFAFTITCAALAVPAKAVTTRATATNWAFSLIALTRAFAKRLTPHSSVRHWLQLIFRKVERIRRNDRERGCGSDCPRKARRRSFVEAVFKHFRLFDGLLFR